MKHIIGIDPEELAEWLAQKSCPSYRTDQILAWIYKQNCTDYTSMTNLPADLKDRLSREFTLRAGRLDKLSQSPDGTIKLLLRWPDDALTETVLIFSKTRRTVCISTQVGCPVQCAFCASGLDGLQRSLESGEIVEQVLHAQDQLDKDERITNVVIMGMGEPLANYDNTLKAVKIINADWALGIGARHITISTIGLPDQIRRLAHESLQITLAVSLHAANDELRANLIPWAGKIKLKNIFSAIDYYYQQTHREVTLEYVLLDGVNCLPAHADQLAHWVHKTRCNVNLINYNPVTETPFQPASPETIQSFMARLTTRGVNTHLRRSHGPDINAACGQLRKQHLQT
ncbi:MAG: 23S rRNA (adenine(2503)-C(2))-methyltransferase RlmN [Sedimentisphaerales bacterium]|nr:23S rRNA (adenine(2503)-C(2))-methyltransferase RlmN [Sedimentisphaerales bacterium]